MQRITLNDFRSTLPSLHREDYDRCVERGVVFRFRLDCPWYYAELKNITIAEGFAFPGVITQATDYLIALDNLKGTT